MSVVGVMFQSVHFLRSHYFTFRVMEIQFSKTKKYFVKDLIKTCHHSETNDCETEQTFDKSGVAHRYSITHSSFT